MAEAAAEDNVDSILAHSDLMEAAEPKVDVAARLGTETAAALDTTLPVVAEGNRSWVSFPCDFAVWRPCFPFTLWSARL